VPAIATFDRGEILAWHDGPVGELPACDLVLKPTDLACGRGFQRWSYDAQTERWQRDGQSLDAATFVRYCCATAASHTHVLQARLQNHRELRPLSSKGLSTVRVVTYRRPAGECGVLLACLRMPTGSMHVDNFEAGGIAAPIDLETGRLGVAVAKNPVRGRFSHHPDSGAPIEGTLVPDLEKALAITRNAHQCYGWMPFVGWDVVLTDDGPVLLEANPDWCVELAQIAMARPLSDTIYPAVYLEHLAVRQRAATGDRVAQAGAAV
jgi:hypothetical protein